jgi:taurine dioxygenase
MTITTTPLSGALGAEVHGLDPNLVDEADRAHLRAAFLEYGVLLARGLADMTPDQHIELSGVFGACAIHPIPTIRLKGHPEIIVLAAELGDTLREDDPSREEIVGQIPWHSDLTYTDAPSRGSLLLARAVPPELGMTGFIDTATVYDALPQELRARVAGRRAIHSLGPIQAALRSAARSDDEMEGGEPPTFEQVTHPLVHGHPESGRRVLNVSPAFGIASSTCIAGTWVIPSCGTTGGRCTSPPATGRSTRAACTGRPSPPASFPGRSPRSDHTGLGCRKATVPFLHHRKPTRRSRPMNHSTDAPQVRPISGALGAEVRGFSLRDVDAAGFAKIRDLLLEHLVLFFPEQHLTPDEHRSFAIPSSRSSQPTIPRSSCSAPVAGTSPTCGTRT